MDRALARRFRVVPPRRRLEDRLRGRSRALIRLYHFALMESRTPWRVSPRTRWRAWRRGFFTRSCALYDLDRQGADLFLPDQVVTDYFVDDPHYAALGDKLLFSRLMEGFGVPHPRVFAYLARGRVHPLDPAVAAGARPGDTIRDLLAERRRLVVKPSRGGGGQGILMLHRDGDALRVNGVTATSDELRRLLADLPPTYVSERVEQHPYARALFPSTTNTVRVLTLWDLEKHEPFVAAGAQRIGSRRSLPVDNFHQGLGGLSARIDPATGALGPGVALDREGGLERHARHPDSGAAIEGVVVPFWNPLQSRILDAAAKLPQCPLIGWDLVVTEEGFSALEANCPPGTPVWQAHDPLLADPRSRRFFEEMGMARVR